MHLAEVVRLQVLADGQRFGDGRAARELLRGQLAPEVAQGQRVASGRRDDVAAHEGIHVAVHDRAQQLERTGLVQAHHLDHGQPGERREVTGAGGDEQCDPLGLHPTADEAEHAERVGVEPVRVVDADERGPAVSRRRPAGTAQPG